MRPSWWNLLLFLAMLALTAAAALPAAAARSHERAASPAQIAIFVNGLTSYTQPALDYAKKHFAGKAKFDVFSGNFDPQKMVSQCQDALVKNKYQGWVVYPADNGSMVPCVKDAIKQGVKVSGWDYPPLGPDPLSEKIQVPGMVGQDILSLRIDVAAAVALTKRACAGKNPCKVAMLIAIPTFGYTAVKLKQTLAAFKKLPNIKVVSQSTIGFDAPDKAYNAIQTALQKDPDLNVVLGDDDSGIPGAERAVKEAGKSKQVKLIGDGANKYGVRAIRDGRWFGTVVALPKTGIRNSVQMVLDALQGKPIKRRVILNELESKACKNGIVDRSCARRFIAEW